MGVYLSNKDFIKVIRNSKNSNSAERVACYEQIANKLLTSGKFWKYSRGWKEVMKQEAIANCIQYGRNFSLKKSKNPFAYYSTIIHNAFYHQIKREKKRLYEKLKMIHDFPVIYGDEATKLSGENWYRKNLLEQIQDDASFEVDEAYVDYYIKKYEARQ